VDTGLIGDVVTQGVKKAEQPDLSELPPENCSNFYVKLRVRDCFR